MRNKPLFFTVLSVLCFIEPVIKVLYFKASTHFDFAVIFSNLSVRNTFVEVVDFWLVFPIAGLFLLKLRKWTYFGFLSVLSYIVYNTLTYERYTWPYNSATPFIYNYVVVGLCVGAFFFFLFPQIREPFFERRVRLWETKTRYSVDMSCHFQADKLTFSSRIVNISKTGAFIQDSPYLKIGETYVMDFEFVGQRIEIPVKVIHKYTSQRKNGYGVEFKFKNLRHGFEMARVIKIIKESDEVFKKPKFKSAA